MSLINAFLTQHLLGALEEAFIAYEPQLQELVMKETQELISHLVSWVESKREHKNKSNIN